MKKHEFEGVDNCDHFEGNRQCCLEPDAEVHQVENECTNQD